MYWPVGTPKSYATSNNIPSTSIYLSHDDSPDPLAATNPGAANLASPRSHDYDREEPSPNTPITPVTPAVRSVEDDELDSAARPAGPDNGIPDPATRLKEPILALKISRTGHIFVVATATTIAVWQTKVCSLGLTRRSCSKPVSPAACRPSSRCSSFRDLPQHLWQEYRSPPPT